MIHYLFCCGKRLVSCLKIIFYIWIMTLRGLRDVHFEHSIAFRNDVIS